MSLQYSYNFPELEKTMIPIWASHSTESSWVFLNNPTLRFAKVTCLVVRFSILEIDTLLRPIFLVRESRKKKGIFILLMLKFLLVHKKDKATNQLALKCH